MKRIPQKDPLAEDRFIKGEGSNFPWNGADDRIIKNFNLRLPESWHMKLQFISENTPHSIHSFIMEVLEAAIEKQIDKMTK